MYKLIKQTLSIIKKRENILKQRSTMGSSVG